MTKLPLSKQLTFVAIVGGVAFVVSTLLGMLAAAAGPNAERGTPSWFIGMVLGVTVGSFYLLLAGNRKVRLAGGAERIRALGGPEAGQAQLLVVREGFIGKLAGVDVLIDGAPVTQLKSPRFAALPLAPGRHEVVARVQGKSTEPLTVDAGAGETVVVRIEMGIGKAKLTREHDVAAARQRVAKIPMVAALATA